MDQRVEEQMLKRAERFDAEQVFNAHCPGATMRYENGVAAILSKEAEEKEERETTVHKQNGARRAPFISNVHDEDEDEDEFIYYPNPIDDGGGGDDDDDSDDDQSP